MCLSSRLKLLAQCLSPWQEIKRRDIPQIWDIWDIKIEIFHKSEEYLPLPLPAWQRWCGGTGRLWVYGFVCLWITSYKEPLARSLVSGRFLFLCCSGSHSFSALSLTWFHLGSRGRDIVQHMWHGSSLTSCEAHEESAQAVPALVQLREHELSTHVGGCGFLTRTGQPCTAQCTSSTMWAFILGKENFQPSCLFLPLLACCETGRECWCYAVSASFSVTLFMSMLICLLLQYVDACISPTELKLGVPSHWSLPNIRWQKCLFSWTLNCIQIQRARFCSCSQDPASTDLLCALPLSLSMV